MPRGMACLIALVVLTGCGRRAQRISPEGSARVICGTPAVAEIVFALGCGDQVVGVSAFSDWPPEAAAKPLIGGALSPNRERILKLEPTLILTQGKAEILGGWARTQQIPFVTVPLDTLGEVKGAIQAFASALGVEKRGEQLWSDLEGIFATIPSENSVSVFISIGHAPGDLSGLMTSGPGTFLDELVSRAGGSNIFSDVQIDWPGISQETLIRRAPAILLDFQHFPLEMDQAAALVADWERLGFRADQVRLLDEAVFLRPGPRAVQSAPLLAEAIHSPEQ
jgi:cobalamin transport system substrate-binding protein